MPGGFATPEGYEVSANYLMGFGRSVRALNLFDEARGSLAPELTEAFDSPALKRWWAPTAVEHAAKTILERRGESVVESIGYGIMIPSVAALFKVTLALLQSDPARFLAKMGEFSAASIRGVGFEFAPRDAVSGELVVTYPHRPPRSNGLLWKGALVRTFEATDMPKLRVAGMRFEGPSTFRFDARWD